MIDVELLRQEALTDMIQDFKPANLMLKSSGLLPVQSGAGNSFNWDILKQDRDIDTFEGDLSPAGQRKLHVIGNRSAKLMHTFKSVYVPGFTLMDLRNPGTQTRQRIAEDTVGRELLALSQLLDRQDEFMIARALQGSLTVKIDGLAHTIDYGFSNTHKPTVGSGIPLAWSDLAADVLKDIQEWKRLIAEDSGYQASDVWCSTETIQKLIKNDFVQSYFASTPQGVEALTRGVIGQFMGLTWHAYDGTYKDSAGVLQRFIPKDVCIVCPGPDMEWGFWREGSDVVPTDDKRNIQEVVGKYAYSTINENPASIALYTGYRRLPIVRKPDALVVATIA